MNKATATYSIGLFQHKFAKDVSEEANLNGLKVWRPVVPMPLWVGFGLKKAKCDCGQVFKDEQAYKNHFIYQAVWQNESNYLPELIASVKAGPVEGANKG